MDQNRSKIDTLQSGIDKTIRKNKLLTLCRRGFGKILLIQDLSLIKFILTTLIELANQTQSIINTEDTLVKKITNHLTQLRNLKSTEETHENIESLLKDDIYQLELH